MFLNIRGVNLTGDAAGGDVDVSVDGSRRRRGRDADGPWTGRGDTAAATWIFRGGATGRRSDGRFPRQAGADGVVEVWDAARTSPARRWTWGSDNVFKARWNPAEPSLLCAVSRDRACTLYDARAKTALRRTILGMPCRALAWNPREPTTFVVGGEDGRCLTFDVRSLNRPRLIHEGHVGAVADVAFSPSGLEFATASADRTCRVFPARGADAGRSRDVYHALRMQAVACVRFTADASFVLTASEDFNLRVWKAEASRKLAPASRREQAALDYRAHLLKRHAHAPQVRKIARSRNLPKMVKKLRDRRTDERQRARDKLQRQMDHSRPGTVQPEASRSKVVVREIE